LIDDMLAIEVDAQAHKDSAAITMSVIFIAFPDDRSARLTPFRPGSSPKQVTNLIDHNGATDVWQGPI
jgi:hypothetical protein